jgi:hypothetical protein
VAVPVRGRQSLRLNQQEKINMEDVRVPAAIAELNNLIQALIQRNVTLACDLGTANAEVGALKAEIIGLKAPKDGGGDGAK